MSYSKPNITGVFEIAKPESDLGIKKLKTADFNITNNKELVRSS